MSAFVHVGIVLAAGASSRMRQPKALLPMSGRQPLAVWQHNLLASAGFSKSVIVIGCDATVIAPHLLSCPAVVNPRWAAGRFTSVLAGLSAFDEFDGCLILPVDTVGLRADTLRAITSFAETHRPRAVRPYYRDQRGRVVWLSSSVAASLLTIKDPSMRLDNYLSGIEARVDVDDPAILSNVNTPEEWERFIKQLR